MGGHTLELRPGANRRWAWILFLVWLPLWLLVAVPNPYVIHTGGPEDTGVVAFMSVMMLLGTLGILASRRARFLEVDEVGVRLRSGTRVVRGVAWDQVRAVHHGFMRSPSGGPPSYGLEILGPLARNRIAVDDHGYRVSREKLVAVAALVEDIARSRSLPVEPFPPGRAASPPPPGPRTLKERSRSTLVALAVFGGVILASVIFAGAARTSPPSAVGIAAIMAMGASLTYLALQRTGTRSRAIVGGFVALLFGTVITVLGVFFWAAEAYPVLTLGGLVSLIIVLIGWAGYRQRKGKGSGAP